MTTHRDSSSTSKNSIKLGWGGLIAGLLFLLIVIWFIAIQFLSELTASELTFLGGGIGLVAFIVALWDNFWRHIPFCNAICAGLGLVGFAVFVVGVVQSS